MSRTAADCNVAYFVKDNIHFNLLLVHPDDMKAMRTDPDTGLERDIYGYPLYYTRAGDLFPLPGIEGVKVVYE